MAPVGDAGPPAAATRRVSLDYLTVRGADPVEQIEAAAAAGFDSVGLRFLAPPDLALAHEVVGNRSLIRAIRAACRRTGVEPLDVEVFFLSPAIEPASHLRALDAAAEIGASMILAVCADGEHGRAVDRFARLCDAAAPSGIRVALEFMRWSPVATVDDALAFVTDANRPNAGVCVDALHLSRSGGSPRTLPVLPRAGTFVQLCDARLPGPPPEGLLAEAREDRLYPGEGDLWLDDLLDALPQDTPISVEAPRRADAGRGIRERAILAGQAIHALAARHRMEG